MSAPSEMYCLKCKAKTTVKDVSAGETRRKTKHGMEAVRKIYTGVCTQCEKRVSRFAKNDPVAEVELPQ